jgi:L,D-transpeptidase catalytic domain
LAAVAAALAFVSSSPAADARTAAAPRRMQSQTEHASKEPFGNIPKGPVQIIIAVDQQKLHLYSDGVHITDTLVATGLPSHPTPLGVFDIIQKSLFHRSNIYSNAPMPYMQRITWSGVALHEGVGVGHRASHGCIRMPHDFATRLWALTRPGAQVVIAGPELRPQEFADPHLFVHKEEPPSAAPPVASAMPSAKPLMTAQSVESGKTSDALRDQSKDAIVVPPAGDAADRLLPAADRPAPVQQQGVIKATDAVPADPLLTAPPATPIETLHKPSKAPIAIFISRKDKKIFVRQDFAPLFSAAITFDNPQQRCGTHVFTALDYLADGSTLRWNVISLPGDQTEVARRAEYERTAKARRRDERSESAAVASPPQTPQQALARITIPQDVIDRISQLIVPGTSLIISDQGLGDETGEGTDFIVVTR